MPENFFSNTNFGRNPRFSKLRPLIKHHHKILYPKNTDDSNNNHSPFYLLFYYKASDLDKINKHSAVFSCKFCIFALETRPITLRIRLMKLSFH